MSTAVIDPIKYEPTHCDQGRCLARKSCPVKAIWQEEPYAVPFLSAGRCNGCSKCLAACPIKAIYLDGIRGQTRYG
ncbi:MAG: 4Fe-4S binding protein [Chloroflexi bacterium]|nr:4Fe-4S binding protein [Chloroflexota bacterium]